MDKARLMKAIRELREYTGKSQTDFARVYFQKTLSTQQRYEGIRPPPPKILAIFVKIARENGRSDLADIFKAAAIESVPQELRNLIAEPAKLRLANQKAEAKN